MLAFRLSLFSYYILFTILKIWEGVLDPKHTVKNTVHASGAYAPTELVFRQGLHVKMLVITVSSLNVQILLVTMVLTVSKPPYSPSIGRGVMVGLEIVDRDCNFLSICFLQVSILFISSWFIV